MLNRYNISVLTDKSQLYIGGGANLFKSSGQWPLIMTVD